MAVRSWPHPSSVNSRRMNSRGLVGVGKCSAQGYPDMTVAFQLSGAEFGVPGVDSGY